MKNSKIILINIILLIPGLVLARDIAGGIDSLGEQIRQIMSILGPIMLVLAGGMFWFSRQAGLEKLISTIIGIGLFGGASTIYSLIYRAFN